MEASTTLSREASQTPKLYDHLGAKKKHCVEIFWIHFENVVRSTLSYPNETSKECNFQILESFVVEIQIIDRFSIIPLKEHLY
jgi:hypothetical protein